MLLFQNPANMNKSLLLFLLVCCSTNLAKAQLYVGSTSYVFVKNEVLFINQDVDIQNNGVLYLRNEAQLIQGTTGSSIWHHSISCTHLSHRK